MQGRIQRSSLSPERDGRGAQIPALTAVSDTTEVRVYSPTPLRRDEFCSEMRKKTGLDVKAVDCSSLAVNDADIVAATSSLRKPVITNDLVQEGMHLSCIVPYEFGEETWKGADRIVASQLDEGQFSAVGGTDSFAPTKTAALPLESPRSKIVMLSDLLNGRSTGRSSDEQVTLFYKGLGLGIEFAAMAKIAYLGALKIGLGKEIPTDWFTQESHT